MSRMSTPAFPRSLKLGIEETDLIAGRFAQRGTDSMIMLDVGAHRGTSTRPFAECGWRVYAFEPSPANRAEFLASLSRYANVTVDPRAVSDVDDAEVVLYCSEESTGITSLAAFTAGHRPMTMVRTVRLDTFMEEHGIQEVDFLKMDTEGFDLMVLQGFPWDRVHPQMVLCEFEDNKSVDLGYSSVDMIEFLVDRDYTVLVSEWHPVERYGVTHSFRQLRYFDGVAPPTSSWGNLVAVADPEDAEIMISASSQAVGRRSRFFASPLQSLRFVLWKKTSGRSGAAKA